MRTFVFTMAWWENREHAWQQAAVLTKWLADVQRYYLPRHVFIACGTWSDPMDSPLPVSVPTINGGVKKDRPYDSVWWNYAGSALVAALSYALIRDDWELLILHDTDMLVGAVDFDALLTEFIARPEIFMCANWHGRPGGGSPTVWKREAAAKWLNQRQRANLIEHAPNAEAPMLMEDEFGEIFKGLWWNPWPQHKTMRQDYGHNPDADKLNAEVMRWPFIRMPHPDVVAEYQRTQTTLAKPMLSGV